MLKKHLQKKIENIVGLKENPVNFLEPCGDKGLFGPTSMVWKVHGDFSSMLVGGITALCYVSHTFIFLLHHRF